MNRLQGLRSGLRRRSRPLLACLWIAAAALAAAGLGGHRIDNDLSDWMPHLVPESGAADWVVVGLPADRAGAAELLGLAARLRTRPEVDRVVDPVSLTAAARVGGPDPAGLTGRPGDPMTAVWVFGRETVAASDLLAAVEAELEASGLPVAPVSSTPMASERATLHLAGPATFRVAINQWSQRGLAGICGLQVLVSLVLFRAFDGRWSAAVAGAGAIAAVQVILLGTFAWHRTPLDLALSLVPPLVAAMGTSFVMHRSMRAGSGPAIAASCATSMLGIGVFAFGGLLPLLRFGTWGATGVGLAGLAAWMLVPPPDPAAIRRPSPRRRRAGHAARSRLERCGPRSPRTAAAVCLLVIAGAAVAVPHLRFQEDPLRGFPAGSAVRQDFERIDAQVAGMLPLEVTARGGDGHFDPTDLIEGHGGVRRLVAVPDDPGRWWGLASNDAAARLRAAMPEWTAIAAAEGVDLEFRGVGPALAAIGGTVRRIAAGSVPLMILVAAIAGGVVGRSVRAAAAAGIVNAVPAAAMAIMAAVGGLELGLPALLVAAIATGAGIDDTVHLIAAARELGPRRARRRCLNAALGSTVVASACASFFLLSPFGPVRQFGGLLAATLVAAVLADLLLLPPLLTGRPGGPRHG